MSGKSQIILKNKKKGIYIEADYILLESSNIAKNLTNNIAILFGNFKHLSNLKKFNKKVIKKINKKVILYSPASVECSDSLKIVIKVKYRAFCLKIIVLH